MEIYRQRVDFWQLFDNSGAIPFFAQAREPKELRWTKTGHVGKRNRNDSVSSRAGGAP